MSVGRRPVDGTAQGCPVRCNFHSVALIAEAGTIDQLVADAAEHGYPNVGVRLVRDWSERGLLDYPRRRSAGKGHGSLPALYSAHQRNLFLSLLERRATNSIRSLARIPVGIWTYWGDTFVPTSQARRAFDTWLGDPRSSRKQARHTAHEVLHQLDQPQATPAARRELLRVVTEAAYTARIDDDELARAIHGVFEPGSGHIPRAIGHPAAPLMAESMITVLTARLAAARRVLAGEVDEDEFSRARHLHRVSYAEYAAQQAAFAAAAPAERPDMYEPVTAQEALTRVCGHLLTTLGLATLNPDVAAADLARPLPPAPFLVRGHS
jgi:hypothetical protein